MTIRIGTNCITWSNNVIYLLGGDTPPTSYLAKACQKRVAGVQNGNEFPTDLTMLNGDSP